MHYPESPKVSKPGPLCSLGVWAKCLAHPLLSFQDISLLALMCAKLRTYNLLLLLRLSGAYLIIQMGLFYKLILYLLFTSHGTIAYMSTDVILSGWVTA